MHRTRRSARRRANAAITALSLGVLLGFGALAVDVAWVRALDAQLEAATDAGALAGASQLDGTPEGLERAIALAVEVANTNPVAVPVVFGPEHVELGRWDPSTRTFEPLGTSAPEITDMVRFSTALDGIPAVLAGAAFGVRSLSTRGTSGAWRQIVPMPASRVDCYLPLVLPTCLFPEEPKSNPPPLEVNFGNNNTDTVGWGMPGGVNAHKVKEQIEDGCSGAALEAGDTMSVQNGVVSSAIAVMGDVLNDPNGRAEPWPEELLGLAPDRKDKNAAFPKGQSLVDDPRWGHVLQGPVALVDLGGAPGSCAGAANFHGERPIAGFTWGVVYDARKGNAQSAGFMIQLDFVNEYRFGTEGSPDAPGNVTAPTGPPKLVL